MAKVKKIKLTKAGLQELTKELEDLKTIKRPQVVARLSNARDQGDLSENSDYIGAREELEFIDDRIAELARVVENAEVAKETDKHTIAIGNEVTVKVKGKKYTYAIVGDWEADPRQQKISEQSPLGQALRGKKVGDTVEVNAPAGLITYEILQIQ